MVYLSQMNYLLKPLLDHLIPSPPQSPAGSVGH